MKPRFRKVITVGCGFSFLLCVATYALWVLSALRTDSVGWAGWRDKEVGTWHGCGLSSEDGGLTVYYFTSATARFDDPTGIDGRTWETSHGFHHVFGHRPPSMPPFRFGKIQVAPSIHLHLIGAPHWVIAIPLTIAPAWMMAWGIPRALHRRRQRWAGCCRTCGYDLRASPDRCPECGTVPPVEATT
jgi:hypothetical protein